MPLRSIDDFLVDEVFQKISNFLQEHTGKSCFWFAKVCLIPWPISVLIFAATGRSAAPLGLDMGIVLTAVALYFVWDRMEKKARASVHERVVNPMRLFVPMGLFRSALLIFAGGQQVLIVIVRISRGESLTVYVPHIVLTLLWICSWYFGSCTPKPLHPFKAPVSVHA